MPLLQCPECSGEVSSHAQACPHCGLPAKNLTPTHASLATLPPIETFPNSGVPSSSAPPPIALPRRVTFSEVVLFLIAFVAVWNFGPPMILEPVAMVTGLALAYFGVAMFFPLRRWLYLTGGKSALRVELLSGFVSLVLALISLAIWEQLFTSSKTILFPDPKGGIPWLLNWLQSASGLLRSITNDYLVYLWSSLTWLFGYLFFVSRKVFALSKNQANSLSTTGTSAPAP